MTEPPRKDYYTVAEVARLARVSDMTIWRYCNSGQLEHVRIGRLIRIPSRAVRKLLEPASQS